MKGSARRIGVVAVICALIGALAGIAGSAAAPAKSKTKAAQKRAHAKHFGLRMGPGAPGMEHGGPPVHAEMVVPNKNGDGFDRVTIDAGKIRTIDGTNLTITEGTDKATYGEPTIDVGGSATVVRNHQKATVGDLKEGDFARVVQGPGGTFVMAEDAVFRAQEQKDHGHFGPGGFGPEHGPPGG